MIGFLLLLTTMPQIASVMAQTAPLTQDNVKILENLPGRDDVNSGWVDSYSVENVCYCFSSNYDHGIGDVLVDTPFGVKTVRQACELLGPGPGSQGRPLYNDIQCGNGPPNSAIDETECPGRIEYGAEGCKYIGPLWDFGNVQTSVPTDVPMDSDESGDRPNSVVFDALIALWMLFWSFFSDFFDA